MRYLAPLLPLLVLAAACGDDDAGPCGPGESLEMLAPADGATLTMADDVDPTMGGLQVEIAVLACGFEVDEQVAVWTTAPFETPYVYLTVADSPTLSAEVELVPGDITMEARGPDGAVVSEPVSFTVILD